jgi:hypothetical protein
MSAVNGSDSGPAQGPQTPAVQVRPMPQEVPSSTSVALAVQTGVPV